jgi:hypothetical protein
VNAIQDCRELTQAMEPGLPYYHAARDAILKPASERHRMAEGDDH